MDSLLVQQALLDAIPAPLLFVAAGGQQVHANPAAQALAPSVDVQAWCLWLTQLAPLLQGRATHQELVLPDTCVWVRVHGANAPGGGQVLSLQAITDERAAQATVAHLQEMLELAREFGRLGFWERDTRSLEGHWDVQVQAFRGLPADSPTPSFAESLQQVAQADRATLDRVFRASLRHPGVYSQRFSLHTADGTLRRVHSHWRVKAGDDGTPTRAVGLLVDDTETLNLAGITGELESQLALAVDLGRIAIWRHDLRTQRVHWNAQAWSMLNLAPNAEGLHIDDVRALMHPDDLPAVLASAKQALRSRKPTDLEARFRRADGSWRPVLIRRVLQCDEAGARQAFIGVAMDVSERRDAETALRSAAERVAMVTRAAGLGTWEVDLSNERAIWDEQMWLLRGLQPKPRAMTTTERLAAVHPDDRERVVALYRASLDLQKPSDYEFRVVWPDGQIRWLAMRSQTLQDANGRPVRRIGVNWDITAAREAAALRHAGELARRESLAKSTFMARMSHELRTPLNAVLGFTQLMLAEPGGQQAQRQQLEHVRAAGEHLLTLVNDALDLAGLQSGELHMLLQPVDLQAVLRSSLAMLTPLQAQGQIAVDIDLPPEQAWTVLADAARLRQVLLNLLGNAIKYNRANGRVDVKAEREGPDVKLHINDTGCGMSAEQLSHLFEPFNRLGAQALGVEGSGIGLTVAKSLAERMGGRLEVHSRLGRGSRFTLSLPGAVLGAVSGAVSGATSDPQRAAPTTPASDWPDEPVAVAKGRPHRVLYIEDNPVNALIIAELLARRTQLELHLAEDGISGLAMAQQLLPDLLLLDMQLPDISGLEVLRRLRAEPATARMPCFALSANAMPDDIQCALQAGADDYWTKPVDFAAFLAAVDRLFSKPTA
jgi:PAS domain S-box-containing protein